MSLPRPSRPPHDDPALRRISHAELVYRPGERALARRVFEVLGCRVVDRGGEFFTAMVEPEITDWVTNVLYASEVTPEQWAFEQAAFGATADEHTIAAKASWQARLREDPQHSFHFGLRLPTEAALARTLDGIREAGAADGDLAGRIEVSGVFRPGDPGAATDTMVQAFVRTDVVACGLLSLGQHIELQWHVPVGP